MKNHHNNRLLFASAMLGGILAIASVATASTTIGTDISTAGTIFTPNIQALGPGSDADLILSPKGNNGSVVVPIDSTLDTCANAFIVGPTGLAGGDLLTSTCGPMAIAGNQSTGPIIVSNSNNGNYSYLAFFTGGGTVLNPTKTLAGSYLGKIQFGGFTGSGGGTATFSGPIIYATADNDFDVNTHGSFYFKTYGGGPEFEMDSNGDLDVPGRIMVDGKVGIGTSTPATQLHVSSGASATTTVTIGELGLSSSKGCVNMNKSNGQAASFYISAANTIVVEANYCR